MSRPARVNWAFAKKPFDGSSDEKFFVNCLAGLRRVLITKTELQRYLNER